MGRPGQHAARNGTSLLCCVVNLPSGRGNTTHSTVCLLYAVLHSLVHVALSIVDVACCTRYNDALTHGQVWTIGMILSDSQSRARVYEEVPSLP